MFNIMLDRYPREYKGYLIDTDFRIGIQISLCLSDENYSETERVCIALNLLYGKGIPDVQTAIDGLKWFMSCGKEIKDTPDEPMEKYSDYDYDADMIASAFRKAYGIDLATAKLHWFEFNCLMNDLGECSFTKVIQIRQKKLTSEMSQQEKEYYRKAKQMCALPSKMTIEEEEKISEFMALLNGGDDS